MIKCNVLLVPLEKHISNLCRALSDSDCFIEWCSVLEWLRLAGSMEFVKLDTIKNDDTFGWCSDADEYAISRDELMNSFVTKLTVFNFVWGALESTIDIVKPPKHPLKEKRGKISNTSYLLGRKYTVNKQLLGLDDQTIAFKDLSERCFGFERIQDRIKEVLSYGNSGVGLYAVYELRNLFAHGSMSFPEPDEEDENNNPYNSLVEHATRIVLLSIQMLALLFFDAAFDRLEHDCIESDLEIELRSCHILRVENVDQASLF